jgi:predicted RNase H-like nuclease (RuvC/YqgF family)
MTVCSVLQRCEKNMRHIYTVSIDADLEKELDEYQKSKEYQTRSEGAIQLLKRGLQYDSKIEELKAENEKLKEEIEELKEETNTIHLPCSVCGKPMNIRESKDDPIYSDVLVRYKNWGHNSCIKKGENK